jgi:ABC-type phosphate transport system substrate-binding protein
MRLRTLALALIVAAASRGGEDDPVRVIVNASSEVSSLDREQLSRLFLGKESRWPDGTPVVPVDQRSGSELRARFTAWAHHRSAAAVAYYWQHQVFSGRGAPPPERGSDDEVIEYVARTPGAIGYVSSGARLAGVKAVKVVAG